MLYTNVMECYRKNASAVFSLKYHLVWCPKYRRAVLIGDIDQRLRELIFSITEENEIGILALEIMPDHVHLFIESDPRFSVAGIVNMIKGRTSRILRQEFPSLRSRLPTLWTRSYYAGSVGNAGADTIQKYIEQQKGR